MNNLNSHTSDLLQRLSAELHKQQLWEAHAPAAEALASIQPFAVDSLKPEQWLQWIFIPRMESAIQQGAMPRGFEITPYFEQAWQGQHASVVMILQQIDKACA